MGPCADLGTDHESYAAILKEEKRLSDEQPGKKGEVRTFSCKMRTPTADSAQDLHNPDSIILINHLRGSLPPISSR